MNIESFKTLGKIILFWVSFVVILGFIMGGFSLIESDNYKAFIIWLLICLYLIFMCRLHFTYKDIYTYSGLRWLDRRLKK
jgi:hypothetical protein